MAGVFKCDIGQRLQQICHQESEFLLIHSFHQDIQEKMYQRLKQELKGEAAYGIVTCCSLHNERFNTHYEEYQRFIVGCCNPFKFHACAVLTNLTTVNDMIREKLSALSIIEINGTQICEDCNNNLMRNLNEFVPSDDPKHANTPFYLPPDYKFQTIQDLYATCIADGHQNFEPQLKNLQAYVLHHLFQRKDVLVTLPTNFGKTLPMIAASFMLAKLTKKKMACLIVSPINTLMKDLKRRLKAYKLKSVVLTQKKTVDGTIDKLMDGLANDEVCYFITSPETLQLPFTRQILTKHTIAHVMVDECHLVLDWGKSFRVDYSNVYETRQFLSCPMALFTATLNHSSIQQLIRDTGLKGNNMKIVSESPDRPEIYLERRTREEKSLDFLVKEAKDYGNKMERTIVFVNSIRQTTLMNVWFRRQLKNRGRVLRNGAKINYISDHFSSATEIDAKEIIMKSFAEADGDIRVLFCTVSYGLGIDNKHVRRVITWDTDNNNKSLWQKISRSCRDGRKGTCIIFTSTDKLTPLTFFKPDTCLRMTILKGFVGYKVQNDAKLNERHCMGNISECDLYNCCSVCRDMCNCSNIYEPCVLPCNDEEMPCVN